MKPRYNVWLEQDGEVVLSRWRIGLLEAIAETGSISAAAEKLEVPYRRAWQRLKEMEARVGCSLVETEVGGAGGGGTRLTARACDLINQFHAFSDGLEDEISARFRSAFHNPLTL
jgi:molybdate transport system regulatory protein